MTQFVVQSIKYIRHVQGVYKDTPLNRQYFRQSDEYSKTIYDIYMPVYGYSKTIYDIYMPVYGYSKTIYDIYMPVYGYSKTIYDIYMPVYG